MATHRCPATGCRRSVDDRYLMCGVHWRHVTPETQRAVYDAYVVGQTAATASPAWHAAADQAVVEATAKMGGQG